MTNVLDVQSLAVSYGGIRAVKGVDLTVAEGELVCLIGANGAGKSSTLRAISGLSRPAGGTVLYQGRDMAGSQAFQRARQGLLMVPEGRGVFPQLSVDENLDVGAYSRRDAEIGKDRGWVFELFPRLLERRAQIHGLGQRQVAGIRAGAGDDVIDLVRAGFRQADRL